MKKVTIISLILSVSFVFAAFASAMTIPTLPKTLSKNRTTTAITSGTILGLANKCQILAQKVDINIAKFNNNKARHDRIFYGLETKISSIIKSLDVKGIDTGNLKADLAVLSGKIDKFESDYQAYYKMLGSAKNLLCIQSSGQSTGKVAEARKLLPEIRKDILDIRSFYQTTIRPDIVALIDQMKALKGTSTTERTRTDSASFVTDSSTTVSQ